MRPFLFLLIIVAACSGKPAPAPQVSNQTAIESAPPPDAAPACPTSCSLDEVGCLLAEKPAPCCAYYSQACKHY